MQVCAISPMTMSLWMPCFLSCKSKSVLAKPLEHQCSCATISRGALNRRNVGPRFVVACTISMMHGIEDAKLHCAHGIQDLQHVGNAVVCFSDSFDAGPDLAALGNEVVVGIDH